MALWLKGREFHVGGRNPEVMLLFQTLRMGFLKQLCNKMRESVLLGGRKDWFQSAETRGRVDLGLDILNRCFHS